MLQDYHGQSRFGRFIAAAAQVGMDPRTYDRSIKGELALYDAKVSKILEENKGIIVLDNYNHSYGNPRLNTGREGQLSLANYTVLGLSAFTTPCRTKFELNLLGRTKTPLCHQLVCR